MNLDDESYPWRLPVAREVKTRLIAAFPEPKDVKGLVESAGVPDPTRIEWKAPIDEVWRDTLTRASAEGALRRLLVFVAATALPTATKELLQQLLDAPPPVLAPLVDGGDPGAADPAYIDFSGYIATFTDFAGRDDVLAEIDRLVAGDGWTILVGGPGTGKSAIIAEWLRRASAGGRMPPHHFIRRQQADWDQPASIVASLSAHLEAHFPDCVDEDAKPERRLIELIGRVAKAGRRTVLVIDGLDEVDESGGESPLPRFLPHALPPGIRVLCATRPRKPYLDWLRARGRVRVTDLDDRRWMDSNKGAVRAFWTRAAATMPGVPTTVVERAIALADGNLLHARLLRDAIDDDADLLARVDDLPPGLRALLDLLWERIVDDAPTVAGLGLLAAAQEELSSSVVGELLGWPDAEQRRFTRAARDFLAELPRNWSGAVTYRPRHDWVREYIADQIGVDALREHHRTLYRKLATWPLPTAPRRAYALTYALRHRVVAGDWDEAWRVAASTDFLDARCKQAGTFSTEQELGLAAERTDPGRKDDFAMLHRALVKESYWAFWQPEQMPALLWNRLRWLGWPADRIDQRLAIPADRGFLRVRHTVATESPALARTFAAHAAAVLTCATTTDGRRALSGAKDGDLLLWDLESGLPIANMAGGEVPLSCAMAPDGTIAVTGGEHGRLCVWSLDNGHLVRTMETQTPVMACTFMDRRVLIAALDDGMLQRWDIDRGALISTFRGHDVAVTACATSPDGLLVTGAQDGTLRVWNAATGEAVQDLAGHTDDVRACLVTADRTIVSTSLDGTLRLWSLDTGAPLGVLTGSSAITACALVPGRSHVVACSDDGLVTVWDLVQRQPIVMLEGHAACVNACAVTPDGRWAISGSDEWHIKVWDLAAPPTALVRRGHRDSVGRCRLYSRGERAVTAGDDGQVMIWDLATGDRLHAFACHDDSVNDCTLSANEQRILSVSDDGTAKLWDATTGEVERELTHESKVLACALAADGRFAVTATSDQVRIWDLTIGTSRDISAQQVPTRGCALGADDRTLVWVDNGFVIRRLDIVTAEEVASIHLPSFASSCAISPDGSLIAVCHDDDTVTLWNAATGALVHRLEEHEDVVQSCVFTPDGRRLVTTADDMMLKVWDVASAECLYTHHGDAVFYSVATTDRVAVAGDHCGNVWVLDYPL